MNICIVAFLVQLAFNMQACSQNLAVLFGVLWFLLHLISLSSLWFCIFWRHHSHEINVLKRKILLNSYQILPMFRCRRCPKQKATGCETWSECSSFHLRCSISGTLGLTHTLWLSLHVAAESHNLLINRKNIFSIARCYKKNSQTIRQSPLWFLSKTSGFQKQRIVSTVQ